MNESNMKYKRTSSHLWHIISNVWPIILGLVGANLGGIVPGGLIGAALGLGITAFMQVMESYAASDIEWSDMELAVHNYIERYSPGIGKIEFRIMGRKFFLSKPIVLHISEGDHFVVWYKTEQWSDILDDSDDEYFLRICGEEPVRTAQWDKNKTFLIPQQDDQDKVIMACLALIRYLIDKSGGQIAGVKAVEGIASIWVDTCDLSVSPVPIVRFNFKGKKDGRPVIYLPDRKGYWILHEDGELEQFADFDRWWNRTD